MPAPADLWMPDVRHARTLVIEAALCDDDGDRYLQAHRAVAHAADAAVLARTGRRLPTDPVDPWLLVARTVPGLAEWATYFAALQRRRQAVDAGRLVVSTREADDLVRDADLFCEAVIASTRLTARPVGNGAVGNRGRAVG